MLDVEPVSQYVATMYWTELGLSILTGWIEKSFTFRLDTQVEALGAPAMRSVLFTIQNSAPRYLYVADVQELEYTFTEKMRFRAPTAKMGWSGQFAVLDPGAA